MFQVAIYKKNFLGIYSPDLISKTRLVIEFITYALQNEKILPV